MPKDTKPKKVKTKTQHKPKEMTIEEQVAEYFEGWQRAKADYKNLEKQIEKRQLDMTKSIRSELVQDLLPILDNFNAAFMALSPADKESEWVTGFDLIRQQIQKYMETQGVEEIKSVGEKFDPNIHSAVEQIKGPKDEVIEEVRKGYILGDLVLRPSNVKVGNGK